MVGMELLTINASVGKATRRIFDGREYLVAPLTTIVPGVLNGSKGALFYPPDEIKTSTSSWDDMPMVVYHPQHPLTGRHQSAAEEGVFDRQGIGFLRNSKYRSKLTHEGWFDVERTRRINKSVYDRLVKGEPIELSTGLFTDNHPAPPGSTFNGRSYDFIARNYRPDHLAILPDQVGACSLKDGCGVLVNRSSSTENAGLHQTRHVETGRYQQYGAGNGKGLVHRAVQQGHKCHEAACLCGLEDDNETEDEDMTVENKKTLLGKIATLLGLPQEEAPATNAAADESLLDVLAILRALHWLYHTDHWKAKGESFYAQHLLFERLYEALPSEYDGLAESIASKYGSDVLDANSLMARAAAHLSTWSGNDAVAAGITAEQTLLKSISAAVLEVGDDLGLDNVLRGLYDTHAGTNLYLLKQATSNAVQATNVDVAWATYNRKWPQAKRDKLNAEDFAGPDQSFPIQTQADIDSAAKLIGKAKDPDAVKKRVIIIAKRKGLKVPDAWQEENVGNSNHPSRRPSMAKKLSEKQREAIVDGLISNAQCCWNEEDRDILVGLRDETLLGLQKQNEVIANATANCDEEDLEEDEDLEESEDKGKKKKPMATNRTAKPATAKPLTEDEWLKAAPESVREDLQFARNAKAKQKGEIISKLTANVGDKETKERVTNRLQSKSLDELQDLLVLAPKEQPKPVGSFLGAAAPLANAAAKELDKDDFLPLPTINYQEWAEEDRKVS